MTPTRRQVLAGSALLASAGCTRTPSAPPPVDPDDALRTAAADRERALLAAYDDLLLARPELGVRLLGVRAEHAVHLQELIGPPATPTPGSTVTATPAVPDVPDPQRALALLADAERLAASAHAGAAVRAASRPLAAILASLAASEHTHPAALA